MKKEKETCDNDDEDKKKRLMKMRNNIQYNVKITIYAVLSHSYSLVHAFLHYIIPLTHKRNTVMLNKTTVLLMTKHSLQIFPNFLNILVFITYRYFPPNP